MTIKTIKILGIATLLTALIYLGYIKVKRFFQIDACLNKGGSWNYELEKCDLDELPNIQSNWVFNKVDGDKLIFNAGQTFKTSLFELEYIGQVPTDNKAPYLIFSGRDCDECDANISIYIHSPSNGKLVTNHGQNCYQYPGTEKDYQTDSVLYISRAFYGQVLDNTKGVICYENRLLEDGKMGRSVFLSRIVNGSLKDTTYEDNGKLGETICLLKKGQCSEITGRQYTSEP